MSILGHMDLQRPHNDLGMGTTGDVLMALLPLAAPVSGRQIAQRADRSPSQVAAVLGDLVHAGIVRATPAPPSILYELIREHVLVPALEAIAASRTSWRDRAALLIGSWSIAPGAVVVFGSAATGAAHPGSDIDVLVVAPTRAAASHDTWQQQLLELRSSIHAWTGNDVEIVEITRNALRKNARLHGDVLRDGVVLAGTLPGRAA